MPVENGTFDTLRFGTIEIDPSLVIDIPKGILGFESTRQYCLVCQPEYQPFAHLQSLQDPALAFTIVNPKLFFPNYKVQVDRREIAELNVTDVNRVQTWVIVTVTDDLATMSANLQGPILINTENNQAKQVVLVRSQYTTRHYLMDEIQKHQTPAAVTRRQPAPV